MDGDIWFLNVLMVFTLCFLGVYARYCNFYSITHCHFELQHFSQLICYYRNRRQLNIYLDLIRGCEFSFIAAVDSSSKLLLQRNVSRRRGFFRVSFTIYLVELASSLSGLYFSKRLHVSERRI